MLYDARFSIPASGKSWNFKDVCNFKAREVLENDLSLGKSLKYPGIQNYKISVFLGSWNKIDKSQFLTLVHSYFQCRQ